MMQQGVALMRVPEQWDQALQLFDRMVALAPTFAEVRVSTHGRRLQHATCCENCAGALSAKLRLRCACLASSHLESQRICSMPFCLRGSGSPCLCRVGAAVGMRDARRAMRAHPPRHNMTPWRPLLPVLQAYNKRATVLFLLQRFEEAIADCRIAMQMNVSSPAGWLAGWLGRAGSSTCRECTSWALWCAGMAGSPLPFRAPRPLCVDVRSLSPLLPP